MGGARRVRRASLDRRGSVSVEFALVSVFLLFPLTAGSVDSVLTLSARAKLNSALHALYIFAWSNPGSAGDSSQLQKVIQAVDPALPASTIVLGSPPLVQGICYDATGVPDSSASFVPASPTVTGSSNTCMAAGVIVPTDIASVIASYSLKSTVELPIPVPFLSNPVILTASGTIQIQ